MSSSTRTRPPRTETVSELLVRLRTHQKPSKGAPAYSRFVNRPVGRVIAAVAFRLGLQPNQVTFISGLFSLCGILALALLPIDLLTGLLVAFCLVLGYACDSADGQVARLQGGGTPAGEWLDHVVDCVKISLLHAAVAVALYRSGSGSWSLLLPLGYLVVANLFFFSFILTDHLKRLAAIGADGAQRPSAKPKPASVLRSLVVLPTDYGLLCVVFVVWGWSQAFLAAYAVLLLGNAGYLALGLPKWYHDIVAASTTRR